MQNYTELQLNQIGIFELRQIGREKGVKSPTTLRRNDLISQILGVQSGKIKPWVKPNLKGRPPKTITISSFNSEVNLDYVLVKISQLKKIKIILNLILGEQ